MSSKPGFRLVFLEQGNEALETKREHNSGKEQQIKSKLYCLGREGMRYIGYQVGSRLGPFE